MKIAIDESPRTNRHKLRGIGLYTKKLIESLQQYEKGNTYTLFTRGNIIPKETDIIHYPYFDLFFQTLPLRRQSKTVITIHDLTPLILTDSVPVGLRGKISWQLQKFKVKTTQAIITDSHASKSDIEKIAGIDSNRIFVIPLASGNEFTLVDDKSFLETIKKKYEIKNQAILYVGDINFNKNIPTLLKAFSLLSNNKKEVELLLVGEAFLSSTPEANNIDNMIQELKLSNKVRRLGYVKTADLVGLYNTVCVYIQPSFYEGFGFPVLEAMSCGCPVVVTKNGALPEIAGDAATYVDAYDSNSIANALSVILDIDRKTRKKMINKGLKKASEFSWKKVARQTVQVYESVVKTE